MRTYAPDQYEEYLSHGWRWNLWVNIADVGLFMFAMRVVNMTTILPALMVRLGASPVWIALLPAIRVLGMRLPQVGVSYHIEGMKRHKPWCLIGGIFQRTPWVLLVALTPLLAVDHPQAMVAVLLLCYLAAHLAFGFNGPAYGELMARSIPEHRRGMFMGIISLLGNGLGVFGGAIAVAVLYSDRLTYPWNYTVLFGITTVILWASYAAFAMNREPLARPGREQHHFGEYLRKLPGLLREDRGFLWFIVYLTLSYSNVIGLALFMPYAMQRFGLDDAHSGSFTLAGAVAVLVSSGLLGLAGDRLGHRVVAAASTAFYLAACVLAIMAWDWRVMFAVFALAAMSRAAEMIGVRNCIYRFAPAGRRPTYLALSSTLPAPLALAFSLGGGGLAEWFGSFVPAIAVSAGLSLLALAALVFGARPRLRSELQRPPTDVPVPAEGASPCSDR